MEIMGTFKNTFNREILAQKEAKAKAKEEKRKAKENREPLAVRIMVNAKSLAIGFVYSFAYVMFTYCIIMFGTLYLPSLLNVIISYFDASSTIVINVECACLFFTAWMFIISFAIIKKVTTIYVNGVKALFHSSKEK